MKGLIFDIKHFAIHDGPGIRQTIFFKGCPLHCLWCHNPESQSDKQEIIIKNNKLNNKSFSFEEKIGKWLSVEEVMNSIKKDVIFFDESGGGVTFSGGEPFMQAGFLDALLNKCKSHSIHTCIDTCGFAPEDVFQKTALKADQILFDIKHLDEKTHRKYTGESNQLILNNFRFLCDHEKDIVIRFPVIPGINDDIEYLKRLNSFLIQFRHAVSGVNILPFHSTAMHKYKNLNKRDFFNNVKEPSEESIFEIKRLFENSCFKVMIGG